MNIPLVLPSEVAIKLRCDLCRSYLSTPPITTHEDKNSCGRCDPGWPRNFIYEELAQFMTFPCSYCEEALSWDQVQNHESKCIKKVILCPSTKNIKFSRYGEYHKECQELKIVCPFESCYVMYSMKDISSHFEKFHKDYVFNHEIEANKIMKEEKIWNYITDTHVCLLFFKQLPFLLFVHSEGSFDENTGDIISYNYYFSVFSLCKLGCDIRYMVSLNLSSESESRTFVMKNQDIKPFNSKIHCITFLHGGMIRHSQLNFMTTKFEKLEKCNDMKLCYHVNLLESTALPIDRYLEKRFINRTGFGKIIECPICKEYLRAPIYNCNTGHTICKNCKDQVTICPMCKAFIGSSRNFAMEDIVEAVTICCFNEMKGCDFVGRVEEISLHEMSCPYNN